MQSWREAAAPQAQQDLDDLLDLVLTFAQKELEERGEFFPFAASVDLHGRPGLLTLTAPMNDERPRAASVVDGCVAALRTKRAMIRAGAVVADVRLPEMATDAISAELEHADGQAIVVLLPYRQRSFGRSIEYGRLRAEQGRRKIWPINL